MVYAARTANLAFIVNVVLNGNHEIIGSFAGDMETAHEKGCDFVRSLVFSVICIDKMEVKMNKEIQEFQESFFFGLSMRQCFFSVLAIAAAVGVYLGTKDTCGTEIAGWLSVFAAAPFAGCGFFRYHQMTLEKFVWVWLKSEILCPKKLVFQSENLYLKCLEETIEIGTRSCRNGTELVERKRSKNRKKKGRGDAVD